MKRVKIKSKSVRNINIGGKWLKPGETMYLNANDPSIDEWLNKGKIIVYNAKIEEGD